MRNYVCSFTSLSLAHLTVSQEYSYSLHDRLLKKQFLRFLNCKLYFNFLRLNSNYKVLPLKKKLHMIISFNPDLCLLHKQYVFLVQEIYNIFFSQLNPKYFIAGFDRFSKHCDVVHFVSLFLIPQGLEQLLYQHVLVLNSVRNSASVLKQLKCKLRKVCHLIKDLCVQYAVPK